MIAARIQDERQATAQDSRLPCQSSCHGLYWRPQCQVAIPCPHLGRPIPRPRAVQRIVCATSVVRLSSADSNSSLYFNQQVGKHNQLPINGINIQEMPVSSAIMSPWTKQVVIHNGEMEIKGWAYSGGGRWVERVECSPDGGFTWYMCPVENMSTKYKFGWRTW